MPKFELTFTTTIDAENRVKASKDAAALEQKLAAHGLTWTNIKYLSEPRKPKAATKS